MRRHKQLAVCSGVRDSAAYATRAQLATEPALFDSDFNFIAGIERALERAGRVVEGRGVSVGGGGSTRDGERGWRQKQRQKKQRREAVEESLAAAWRERRVEVVRLSEGMGRRQRNRTEWQRK